MIPLMWILLRLRLAEEMQKNPSEVRGFFPLLPLEIRGFQAEETMQQIGWTKPMLEGLQLLPSASRQLQLVKSQVAPPAEQGCARRVITGIWYI